MTASPKPTLRPAPIKDRLAQHYKPGINERHLRDLVFPEAQFPKAFRCANQGGPPGCQRAFVTALKRYGYSSDTRRGVWKP